MTAEGEDLLTTGRSLYKQARQDLEARGPSSEAERKLREAHVALRSAMNWLEDSQLFHDAHRLLDEAGALARNEFPTGCHLAYENSTYFQRCPVALAHSRVAFSPEFLVRDAECSICHADYRNCDHVPGLTYGGEECRRVITRLDILDFMLVERPAAPDARIQEISIETSRLAQSLGADFHPGIPVLCDRCLSPCEGVARPFNEG
ncbi:hypothetical protein [Kribbella sp. NPDC049227]|uniref:hypothetical protein n=1 Tax=Kribbella sp. NPDC049227 TaxID=3364113 RepID=UPI00371712B5